MSDVIAEQQVDVINSDGTEISYKFRLEQAGDVCTMFITHADSQNLKGVDHYIATVLMAQADMIEKGLHVDHHHAPDMMVDIERFHQQFGLEYNGKPRILEPALFDFRSLFIQEELDEWREEQPALIEALTSDDGKADHRKIALGLHQQLDALVDLTYVTLGAAYLQFGPHVFHEAWRRVQAANMAKVRCEKPGDSKRGSTFDVIKPDGWTPPDHHDLVKDHAHIVFRMGGEVNPGHERDTTAVRESNGANQ